MPMPMPMPEHEHEHEPMPEYENSLPKKPRLEIQTFTKEELAHLEATEESALELIIWGYSSVRLCKQLSDQLYRSLLDALALLAYLLFDKEELYEIGHSSMLYDQQKKFSDKLVRYAKKGDPIYEVCKRIANTNFKWNRYSLLNECNVAAIVKYYQPHSYTNPFVTPIDDDIEEAIDDDIEEAVDDDIEEAVDDDDIEEEVDDEIEEGIDDDIEEAIKKAKQYPRLTVHEYTLLLLEMISDDKCVKCQEFLLAKAVMCIDVKALYSLEADAIENLVGANMQLPSRESLDELIRYDLMCIISKKKDMLTHRLKTSSLLFDKLLYNEFERREIAEIRHKSPAPENVFDLIELAELRRKAEGSRFINRDHFLWAFDQRECGLDTVLMDELASRMAAEDHPPYHIYDTVLRLARAEYVLPDVNHLAFAVLYGRYCRFGFVAEEVKEMQEKFNHFKTAMCRIVLKPMKYMVSDWWLFGGDNVKDFKDRLEKYNGPWWNPFCSNT